MASSQVVLREFLLALERSKQPLDEALASFAQVLQTESSLSTLLLDIHPRLEPLLLAWPERIGADSRWAQRDSIATFLQVLTLLLQMQTQRDAAGAEAIALKIIREKNVHLAKVVTWSDKPLIEFRALELLTLLAGINGVVARELVRLFPFQGPSFGKLAVNRMKKAEAVVDEDCYSQTPEPPAFQIRTAYVRLVLALTACSDKSVHRFALKDGGLTSSLFKAIDGDNVETLSFIFARLNELVLRNPAMDDKAKVGIFNGHCIHQVLPLLQSSDESIAQIALDVLQSLFFASDALYAVPEKQALQLFLSKSHSAAAVTAATNGPPTASEERASSSEIGYAVKVIRNAVVTIGLNELIRSAHARTLVTTFVTKYPGLLAEYLQALALQLEPKPVFRWFAAASMVQQLLSSGVSAAENGLPAQAEKWCSAQVLASRLVMPLACRKELSRGIQHSNPLVIYSSLGVMEAVLNRYKAIATFATSRVTSTAELENEVRFLLPSPEALVSLLLKLCSSVDRVALTYVRALTVFRLYLECLPQVMNEVKLDFTKILPWKELDLSANAQGSSLQGLIVGEVLRFLITVEDNRLPFLLTPSASDSKLRQLLMLYVAAQSKEMQALSGKVLYRTLLVSGVFGRKENGRASEEIVFWLESLRMGGEACALFTEKLILDVLADPFLFLDHFRSSVGAKVSVQTLNLSPATIAVAAYFNATQSVVAGDLTMFPRLSKTAESYRADPAVSTFGVRILLSVLSTCESPRQISALIASEAPAAKISGEDAESSSADQKKRKRQNDKSDGSALHDDAFTLIKSFCVEAEAASPVNAATKKAKRPGSGHSWTKAKTELALASKLSTTQPDAFVASWEAIVDDSVAVTGTFDHIYHYLASHVDADLLVTKKKSKNQNVELFWAQVPLHLLLQNLLRGLSDANAAATGSIDQLCALVQQRMRASAVDLSDATRSCELVLLFFGSSSSSKSASKQVSKLEATLCDLFQRVFTFAVLSSSTTKSLERIFRKIQSVIIALATKQDKRSALWRRLIAVELCSLQLFYSKASQGNLSAAVIAQLSGDSALPFIATLASSTPPSARLRVLDTLMAISVKTTKKSLPGVLIEHTLASLNHDSTEMYASFAEYRRKKLLARKLWSVLENASKTLIGRRSSFFSNGFAVVGKLGGVPTESVQGAIEQALVPVLVKTASESASDDRSTTEMLSRIMMTLCAEDIARSADTVTSTLLSSLLQQLTNKKNNNAAQAQVLMCAVFNVLGRVQHRDLLVYASTLLPDCIVDVVTGDKQGDRSLQLTFVRHIASADDAKDAFTTSVPSVLQKLSKKHPKGALLSVNQVLGLLLMMRSGQSSDALAKISPSTAAFLVRSGLSALRSLASDQTDVAHVDRWIRSISQIMDDLLLLGPLSASTLKTVLPLFAEAAELQQKHANLASYESFVRFSTVLLKLVRSQDTGDFDFSAHLKAIVSSEHFIKSLANPSLQLTLGRVVFGLLHHSQNYERKLFETLLAAYTMSLSPFDRVLRLIFDQFEAKGSIRLAEFGFRFGSSSLVEHAAEKATHDLVDDSMWLTNGGLEPARIRATIEDFPLDREVQPQGDLSLLSFDSEAASDDLLVHAANAAAYDPSFMLPMLAHFMSSSDLPIAAFVQQGLLGIALRATSSNAECIRGYAYGVVAHTHESLSAEASDFKPGRQVHLLLDVFRNAIEEPLEAISSVVTVFLNDAISILCRPMHAMYPHLNHFLLARPAIDVSDVPMFYSLFNSRAPLTYKQERSWLLHTLRRGVREDMDVSILIRRHVLTLLMSFFGSELADDHTQQLIGQILNCSLQTEGGWEYLVTKAALLEWLAVQFVSANAQTSSAVFLLLMDLLKSALKVRVAALDPMRACCSFTHASPSIASQSDVFSSLDLAQRQALSFQIVNAYGALNQHTRVRSGSIDTTVAHKLREISELVRGLSRECLLAGSFTHASLCVCILQVISHAYSACSLQVLQQVFSAVSRMETTPEESRVVNVLECTDALISGRLLAHPEFQVRAFDQWTSLFQQISVALAEIAIGENGSSHILHRQRASMALGRVRDLLNDVPSLKQRVLAAVREEGKGVYAALL